ncbi:MAG TPA: hypothetical protein VFV17_06250 [Usitatibacteraceae bacterium]|nr:hypothetical protein [Usitatibacteraceae bacterium]
MRMQRAFATGVIGALLLAACATPPQIPAATAPSAAVAPAAPAPLDIELLAGDNCGGAAPVRFRNDGTPFQLSLCVTTQLEAICGSTVKVEPDDPADSGLFELIGVSYPALLDDPNSRLKYPIPVVTPVVSADLGSTGGNAGMPSGNRVRIGTWTLRANAGATKPAYTLRLDRNASLGMRKDGTCGNAYEVAMRGSVTLQRSSGP